MILLKKVNSEDVNINLHGPVVFTPVGKIFPSDEAFERHMKNNPKNYDENAEYCVAKFGKLRSVTWEKTPRIILSQIKNPVTPEE